MNKICPLCKQPKTPFLTYKFEGEEPAYLCKEDAQFFRSAMNAMLQAFNKEIENNPSIENHLLTDLQFEVKLLSYKVH